MAGTNVNAFVMKQKTENLFLFTMNSHQLSRISYVTPRSHENPEEIQRTLKKAHYEDIATYVRQQGTLLPTAIVVALDAEHVTAVPSGDPRIVILQFPEEEGKFAYVLDGQHRLKGLGEPDVPELDLPVVALLGASEGTRVKVFADVNSKQEKVDKVLLDWLYKQIGDLSVDESALMDVVSKLNDDDDSPLKGRIKILPDDKATWIKSPILVRFVRHALKGTNLENRPAHDRATVLKEYMKGVKDTWPDAWGNNKVYSLTRSAGLEIMLGAFSAAKDRVDLNSGSSYTRQVFQEQMRPLADATIELPVGNQTVSLTLDWKRENTNAFSSGQKKRDALVSAVKKALVRADADNGVDEP